MPFVKERYPADWKQISLRVRDAAGWRCEFCGAENRQPHPVTGSRAVLTVAHLDHDTQNNERENLKALCQRCHLRHDAKQHAQTRRRNQALKKGQLSLL